MERRDKVNYYLDLAEVVSKRGTCLRRHYGAVIVKNDEVISTGYVGYREDGRTARISECVSGRRWEFQEENAMSCAAVFMQRRMRLSVPPEIR